MSARRNPTLEQDPTKDLGFGSVVSRQSGIRLLNKDGSFNVARTGLDFWSSLSAYHWLLNMSWTRFFLLISGAYFIANSFFAWLYTLCGPGALTRAAGPPLEPRYLEAFFFSVETLSTIGFGNIVPVTTTANVIVMLEAMCGLLGFALVTGIMFARFAKPTARIVFSRKAVIAPYHGISGFEFRIANARSSQIVDLEAKVTFSRFEERNGNMMRQYYPLELERSTVAFFPLSWTIVHPIDESSPLFGVTREQLLSSAGEFLILLSGLDETFAQVVHARSSYLAEEVEWGRKFVNIFQRDDDGRVGIDMERLHQTEPTTGDDHTLTEHASHYTGGA